MDPIFKKKYGYHRYSRPKRCVIYKKIDKSEKKLDLDVDEKYLFFHLFNKYITPSEWPMMEIQLPIDYTHLSYTCILMSYLAYKDRTQIIFPPGIHILMEETASEVGKIPFFVLYDEEEDALIIALRGSSCYDDFITDSMGDPVSYDGGKIHHGVFTTALYVYNLIKDKLIELNKQYNGFDALDASLIDESVSKNDPSDQNGQDNSTYSAVNKSKNRSHSSIHESTAAEQESDTYDETCDEKDNNKVFHKEKRNKQSEGEISHIEKQTEDTPTKPKTQSSEENEATKNNQNQTKIIITGHSLGAAVAAVVTYFFYKDVPKLNAKCICFAPPPTVSFNLWEITARFVTSFILEGDPVPFLSVQNIVKLTDRMFSKKRFRAITKFILKYLKKNAVESLSTEDLTIKLYPPGQMYLIRFHGKHRSKKKSQNFFGLESLKIQRQYDNVMLCQIYNPDYFANFIRNIRESNHSSKNYMKVLIRLEKLFQRMQRLEQSNAI